MATTPRTAVSRRVRSFMANERINQSRMAQIIGISQPSLSQKLRGMRPWSDDDLDSLIVAEVIGETDIPDYSYGGAR